MYIYGLALHLSFQQVAGSFSVKQRTQTFFLRGAVASFG